jgi:hypothetical protein
VAGVHGRELVAVVDLGLGVIGDGGRLGQAGEDVDRREGPGGVENPRRRASNSASSRTTIRSSAPSTLSAYSLSAGVMKRSPPAIVCLRT